MTLLTDRLPRTRAPCNVDVEDLLGHLVIGTHVAMSTITNRLLHTVHTVTPRPVPRQPLNNTGCCMLLWKWGDLEKFEWQ